jgi:hypothetical protein
LIEEDWLVVWENVRTARCAHFFFTGEGSPWNTSVRQSGTSYRSSFVNGIPGDFGGMDAAEDARFPGLLFSRIDRAIEVGMASVLPGQLVQVLEGPSSINSTFPRISR